MKRNYDTMLPMLNVHPSTTTYGNKVNMFFSDKYGLHTLQNTFLTPSMHSDIVIPVPSIYSDTVICIILVQGGEKVQIFALQNFW